LKNEALARTIPRAIFLAISLLYGFLLVRGALDPAVPLSSDAGSIVEAARRMRWFYDSGWREPLFPFLTRLLMAASIPGGTAIKIVSALSSLLACASILVITERRAGSWAAVIAGLVLMIHDRFTVYGISGDRVTLAAALLLIHAQLLFHSPPSKSRTGALALTGALLPLLRIETLAVVIGAAIMRAVVHRREERELRTLAVATAVSLVLVAPYPIAEFLRTGVPMPGSAIHARFWANCEFTGGAGFPADRADFQKDPYRGAPISPMTYIFGMHSPREVAVRYLRGYALLFSRYGPAYALPFTGLFGLAAAWILLASRKREYLLELCFVLLAHLPFAFLYPLDQVFPGSGIEARFAMHTSAFFIVWAGSSVSWLEFALKRPRPCRVPDN
jgi:hypothetical protein